MVQFWIAYSCLFAITTVCSATNVSLRKHIDILLPWLKDTFHPSLAKNGYPSLAHNIKTERIPTLQKWDKAAVWYDAIVYVLMLLLGLLGMFVTISTEIPYILLMVIAMLLGSMVMFFPRTLLRWHGVKKAIGHYFLAHAGMLVEIKLKEKVGNVENSSGGTNSRS